jgi:hypothetical protein
METVSESHRSKKATGGIRTRDLRFTKPLLYRLSYSGKAILQVSITRNDPDSL